MEQLAWAKEQYANDRSIIDPIVNGFMADARDTSENARRDRERYEQIFQPLEDDLAREAAEYATPELRERKMGEAGAAVAQQFNIQRENAQRELEAYGIDPSATRYAALDSGMRVQQAAAQASASNAAGELVDQTARALRSEAINVGRGYPGQIQGSYGTSLGFGQGAGNQQLAGTQVGNQTRQTAQGSFGLQNQAIGQWGNTLNTGYQNQLDAWNATQSQSSGWGSALGIVGGLLFEDGGMAIPEGASPSQGENVDDVPARLNVGEFVVPKDVVDWYGQKHMYSLVDKAAKERDETMQRTSAIPEPANLPANEQPVVRTALPVR